MYTKGDILRDQQQDSEVVFIERIPDRYDEVVVKPKNVAENRYSDQTVYDYNSRWCEPHEPVIRAVYLESLPADPHELTKQGRALLAQNADVRVYSFPLSRLTPIDE